MFVLAKFEQKHNQTGLKNPHYALEMCVKISVWVK